MKFSKERLIQIIKEECDMYSQDNMDHKEDHEGQMAKRQLFNMENDARELSAYLSDDTELPAWVQSKLTKAADYLNSVKRYLEYDMHQGDYDEVSQDLDQMDYNLDDVITVMENLFK